MHSAIDCPVVQVVITPHIRRIAMSMQRLFRDQEARLTRARAQTGRLKTCSHCGQPGHNKRGCPSLQAPPIAIQVRPAPTTRQKCIICGQHGHNRRTCPQRSTQQPLPISEPKRRPRCSACGGVGHQRRTCPVLHTPPSTGARGVAAVDPPPPVTQAAARAMLRAPPPLPEDTDAMVGAAVDAVVGAWRAGVTRQRVELLLPVPMDHNKWNPWCDWYSMHANMVVAV